ncbi:HAD-IIIA family hydrolase [Sulfurihydrogenibium subterraneum]|uniref:HAD-IIIA family hydrolase n=1 Tax=Sulfurihydrogenibium subterraneum TaxID=171121 RepID=UPI000684EDB4|nr:HAD-IIIA family hydrolase [Sulfurihydrogenibium subterraneum]
MFYCPHDYEKENCSCRKPDIVMALQSKERFKDIDFKKSIVVGDSLSDIEFGKNIGAYSVFIDKNNKEPELADFSFENLYEFALHLRI